MVASVMIGRVFEGRVSARVTTAAAAARKRSFRHSDQLQAKARASASSTSLPPSVANATDKPADGSAVLVDIASVSPGCSLSSFTRVSDSNRRHSETTSSRWQEQTISR